jgi:hypothetical protein
LWARYNKENGKTHIQAEINRKEKGIKYTNPLFAVRLL